jgi:hypothetical protein
MFAERSDALETDLINRGIRPGSDAYAASRDALGRERTDAYNQLMLTGRGQAIAEREQPLRELTMLLGGGNPSYNVQTPQPGVAPVDYAGMVQNNYNQKVGQQNAMMGGIAGLAGTALGGWAMGGFANPFASKKAVLGKMGASGR